MKVFKVDTDGTQKLGDLLASESPLDTTNFDKNLDTTITDVQKLADAVDELELSSLPRGVNGNMLVHNGSGWIVSPSILHDQTLPNGAVEWKLLYRENSQVKGMYNVYMSGSQANFSIGYAGLGSMEFYTGGTQTTFSIKGNESKITFGNYFSSDANSTQIKGNFVLQDLAAEGYTIKPLGINMYGKVMQIEPQIIPEIPSGTINQTLRHNGTEWVATNALLVDDGRMVEGATSPLVTINGGLRVSVIAPWYNPAGAGILSFNGDGSVKVLDIGVINAESDYKYSFIVMDANGVQTTEGSIIYLTQNDELKTSYHSIFNNGITTNGLNLSYLAGQTDRALIVKADGSVDIGSATQIQSDWNQLDNIQADYIKNKPKIYTPIEFTSEPIAEGNSTSYVGYSKTQLGLDGINLIDKVKNLQAYVILNGESKLSDAYIQSKEIDNSSIAISTNTPLVGGDRIKLFIEYDSSSTPIPE